MENIPGANDSFPENNTEGYQASELKREEAVERFLASYERVEGEPTGRTKVHDN